MMNRVKHIDIAKGISISLVAMFHGQLKYFFPEIIEPMALFRMPLFFLLSGVFFSWAASPKDFLIKKSEAMLKPYFTILLLLLFIDFVSGDRDIAWQLKGILYGNGDTISWSWRPLWFLTHLFVVYCFSYILFRIVDFSEFSPITLSVILFLFMVLGSVGLDYFWYLEVQVFYQTLEFPGLPFSLDIILITCGYFILGRLLKFKIINFYPNLWTFILSIVIFLIISQFTNAHIDLNKRVYEYPIFATLGAISGVYIIVSLSYFISKSYWLSFIPLSLGKASIYILIFHSVINHKSYTFFSSGVDDENTLIYLSFFSFGLSIFIPLMIKWVVENNDVLSLAFLPFKSNKLINSTKNS